MQLSRSWLQLPGRQGKLSCWIPALSPSVFAWTTATIALNKISPQAVHQMQNSTPTRLKPYDLSHHHESEADVRGWCAAQQELDTNARQAGGAIMLSAEQQAEWGRLQEEAGAKTAQVILELY